MSRDCNPSMISSVASARGLAFASSPGFGLFFPSSCSLPAALLLLKPVACGSVAEGGMLVLLSPFEFSYEASQRKSLRLDRRCLHRWRCSPCRINGCRDWEAVFAQEHALTVVGAAARCLHSGGADRSEIRGTLTAVLIQRGALVGNEGQVRNALARLAQQHPILINITVLVEIMNGTGFLEKAAALLTITEARPTSLLTFFYGEGEIWVGIRLGRKPLVQKATQIEGPSVNAVGMTA